MPFLNPLKRFGALSLAFLATASLSFAQEGSWKTAFIKRGFVGMADAGWCGGLGGTQRMRTPLQFDGTKVRVHLRGDRLTDVDLTKMALVKGADEMGKITGTPLPILFGDSASLKVEKGAQPIVSDEMLISVTKGTWYVEDQYASQKFPYAYEVDKGYCETGDAFAKETLGKTVSFRSGVLYRVDVFTTDPRGSILCYGDSITHGHSSTPNTDHRYPSILGKLINRPVLNFGQNGDLALYGGSMPATTRDLLGVDTVIFLMGINDIISGGKLNSAEAYGEVLKRVIDGSKAHKRSVYIGTIPPAGGYAKFDANPAKETLRKEFNALIRRGNGADGVIDFDAALADPANPSKLKTEYQSDWLHPNDAGYQKMAETAAKALTGLY
jgi:lysophospholipase L1-like esterase